MSRPSSDPEPPGDFADPRDFYTSYNPAPISLPHPHPHPLPQHAAAPPRATADVRSASAPVQYPVDGPPGYVTSRSPTRHAPPHLTSPRSRYRLPPTSRGPQQPNLKDLVSRFNQNANNAEQQLPSHVRDRPRKLDHSRITRPRSPVKAPRSHWAPQTRKDSPNTTRAGDAFFGELLPTPDGGFEEMGNGTSPYFTRGRDDEAQAQQGASPQGRGHARSHARSHSDAESPSRFSVDQRDFAHKSKHMRSRSEESTHFQDAPQSQPTAFSSPIAQSPFMLDGANHYAPVGGQMYNAFRPSPALSNGRSHTPLYAAATARKPVSKYHKSNIPVGLGTSPTRTTKPERPVNQSTVKQTRTYGCEPFSARGTSPQSTRTRAPIAVASTAASRARANDRFLKEDKPSVDPAGPRARPRRKIPELGLSEFAERRARIERAISVHLEENPMERVNSRSSLSKRASGASSSSLTFDPSEPRAEEDAIQAALQTLDGVTEDSKSPLPVLTHDEGIPANETGAAGTTFEEDVPAALNIRRQQPETFPIEEATILAITAPDASQRSITITNGVAIVPALEDEVEKVLVQEPNAFALSIPVAQLRPQTPPYINVRSTSPGDVDMTPRQPGLPDLTTGDALAPHTAPESSADETYMQKAIREYEETGHVDPRLLALDKQGTGSDNTSASNEATIRVLLDQSTFHFPGATRSTDSGTLLTSNRFGSSRRASYASRASTESVVRHDREHTELFPDIALDQDAVHHKSGQDLGTLNYEYPAIDPGSEPRATFLSDATQIEPGEDQGPTPPPKPEGYSARSSIRWSGLLAPSAARPPSPPSTKTPRSSVTSFSLPEIEVGSPLNPGFNPAPFPLMSNGAPVMPGSYLTSQSTLNDLERNTAILRRSIHAGEDPHRLSVASAAASSPRAGSGRLRPSQESARADSTVSVPSQSILSFSPAVNSTDRSSPSTTEEQKEPSPSERRLARRRNIVKELVDTEYSYHQDMKIIEDLYKATVGEVISADDKKVLFGNADQIEALSLEFYDCLRRAVSPFYIPQKSHRWQAQRGSADVSSLESGEANANQAPDEAQDRLTAVGAVFEQFLPQMERVYGTYLKNHDAANKRLAILQQDPTVMWWLKECHKNASDITTAWDLDSLLVKPVQRILKYPLLLQQLFSITPEDHPDHGALERAVTESTNISHRINEAKKRVDLVESIVNRKRKDSELRSGLAKAFGLRAEKVKERIGIKNDFQDPVCDELAMKFGGHYVRLQVVMRDVQGSLTEIDRAVGKFNAFAQALEQFIDVGPNQYPEIESRWRKFILAIRELSAAAVADHKAQVLKRVIEPMVTALKLHEGPQNVIAKRKKRVVDFVKCKQMEKAGQKPDKKTKEAAELYTALNDQLKIDLPRLYELTGLLVQRCLACHHQLQLSWLWTWEMKLRPVLDTFPDSFAAIVPEFASDHDLAATQVLSLAICDGTLLADAELFRSPRLPFADESVRSSRTGLSASRAPSISSEVSAPIVHPGEVKRSSSGFDPSFSLNNISRQSFTRARSASQISGTTRSRAPSIGAQPPPRLMSQAPRAFSSSRPSASTRPNDLTFVPTSYAAAPPHRKPLPDGTALDQRSPRSPSIPPPRSSGSHDIYSSAMPMSDTDADAEASPALSFQSAQQHLPARGHNAGLQTSSSAPTLSLPRYAPPDTPVLFVAASLFEFNIDRSRREAGFPYLTYVQGEVFDVVGQKGELWLAKNQDDAGGLLGWIWEQHFVILGRE